MLTIKNNAEVAEIYISGGIVDDDEGSWIRGWRDGDTTGYEFPTKLKEQLDAIKDKALEIHINSQGGNVFAGVAMANLIANHKPKTTAIIDGIAASIASQIFFSADVCRMPSNAYLMIHRPYSVLEGNADELRKAAEILDTLQEGLETTYRKKALDGITDEDIHEMMNSETWFTGTQAAEKFRVEVTEPLTMINGIATEKEFRNIHFKNMPKSISGFFLPKNAEDINQINKVLAEAKTLLLNRER